MKADDSFLGKEQVQKLEEEFQKGEYESFLKALDKEFERAGKAGLLGGIFSQMKKGSHLPLIDLNDEEMQEKIKNWQSLEKNLIEERNRKFLEVCETSSDLKICKIIDSVVFFTITAEEEEAIQFLQKLKFKMPDPNDKSLESKVVAIEVQYGMKEALLDVATLRSDSFLPNHEKKKVVLELEKLEKMAQVAKSFNADSLWAKHIKNAKDASQKYYGNVLDLSYLKNLAKGRVEATNDIEVKVKEIMVDFLAERRSLAEKQLSKVRNN